MEEVVQYINKNLPLPKYFSLDSPGIGVYTLVALETAFTSRSSLAPSASPPSPHNSMFVTHIITYGDEGGNLRTTFLLTSILYGLTQRKLNVISMLCIFECESVNETS